jgi:hypothetical protein
MNHRTKLRAIAWKPQGDGGRSGIVAFLTE